MPVQNKQTLQLEQNISQAVFGKADVVRLCLVTLLSGEHLLLEDVPGVGKTLLGKAIAKSLNAKFSRIQFTPDLLPSDILGSSVFQPQSGDFAFHQGPIFANVILADEINRTPPRTQSALLEAMSDRRITVDGVTHRLPSPFLVIATQNPYEFEGTYPLPESQLDRFLMRISVGYPPRGDERRIFQSHRSGEPVDFVTPVLNAEQVLDLQRQVRDILVDESVQNYILDIADASRQTDELRIGVSTRATLSLYRAAQALAFIESREFVVPDDVKRLAVPVFSHRIFPRGFVAGEMRAAMEQIVERLLREVPVPQ
ncbi:MAG: MoxR family ATPase [Planctomycetota bacterium]|nr:MoxR family ATPase [Planctomycetota bacterium]MDA1178470.1 MoxR family ATPase [Planctomycetota bacterium]